MGIVREVLRHVTNGQVLLAGIISVGLLAYNLHNHSHARYQKLLAKSEFMQQCFGVSPKSLQEIVKNPMEVRWLIEPYGKDPDCAIVAGFARELLKDNKEYSPKVLHIINKDFVGRYDIKDGFHYVCTFQDYWGKVGAIDSRLGLIRPQEKIEDLVKIIEKGYGVVKSEDFHYEATTQKIDDLFNSLNQLKEEQLNKTEIEPGKGYL